MINNDNKLDIILNNNANSLDLDNNNNYNIEWTKNYKNLNLLLKIKGLTNANNIYFKDVKKYLIFSLTSLINLTNEGLKNNQIDDQLAYSLKLLVVNLINKNIKNNNKPLYENILNYIKLNYNFIKEGGQMDIFYVSSNLENNNIEESFKFKNNNYNYDKELLPSFQEKINLNNNSENNILTINLYMFSYDSFFSKFLNRTTISRFNRIKNNKKMWGYPFLIVEDLELPTIIYLFKEAGFILNSGSNTWKHKLSPLEENLSNFLYVTDLNENIQNSYLCYSDNIITNKKIDFNLYKEIYKNKDNYDLKLKSLMAQIEDINKSISSNDKFLPKKENSILILEDKIKKIKLRSINPAVLIILIRNHIFELEKKRDRILNIKRYNIFELEKLTMDIDNLNNEYNDNDIIVKILRDKIENLEKDIIKHEKELNEINIETNKNKLINKENKKSRRSAINKAKTKNEIKKIKNLMLPNLDELRIKNFNFMKKTNLLMEFRKNKSKIIEELKNKKDNKLKSENNIKTIIESKKYIENKLNNSEKNLNEVNNNISHLKNTSFSEDILNSINNKSYINKKVKKNKNLGEFRRKFSTQRKINNLSSYFESPLYYNLKEIIDNSPVNEETQKFVEEYLLSQNKLLFENKFYRDLNINYNRISSEVTSLIQKYFKDINTMIYNYKENLKIKTEKGNNGKINSEKIEAKIILNLSNDKIYSLLLGRFLRIISFNYYSDKNNCTILAKDLGQSLLWEFFSQELENFKNKSVIKLKNNNEIDFVKKLSLNQFIESSKEFSELKELATDDILVQIGIKLFNFLIESKLIKMNIEQIDKTHKIHVFTLTENVNELVSNSLTSFNLPSKIPMLTKPKKYIWNKDPKKEQLGGFLLNDEKYYEPLILKKYDLEESSSFNKDNKVYDLVNNISSTGFKINNEVLDFILNEGIKYKLITNFNEVHPLENQKDGKIKLNTREKKTLESFLSIRDLEKNTIGLALIFKNVNEFFIPVRIDNRGRLYCMVEYLNYQNTDLAKSLLLFSKADKINLSDNMAIEFLKIYGANCFGNGLDKKPFSERVKWVDDNEDNIIEFKNGKLFTEAENKLLFISFCFEYQKYYNAKLGEKSFYYSCFPVKLDATCNGFQHISLLLGDIEMAKNVNLLSPTSNDGSIMDLYYHIAVGVRDFLKKMIENDILEKNKNIVNKLNWGQDKNNLKKENKRKKIIESCERLLDLNIDRKLVKTAIMVKPYNASIESRAKYLKENFKVEIRDNKECYLNKEGILLYSYDFTVYATVIDRVLSNEFKKMKELNKYLLRVSNICSELGLPIVWTVPSGLNVKQKYLKSEAIELKPFKYSRTTFSIKKLTKVINSNKQNRALMPNLVHSLDASSLCLLVDGFYNIPNKDISQSENLNFFSIHDCFATTCNKFNHLINILKAVYIQTYCEEAYLKKYDEGIINNIILAYGKESFNLETRTIIINVNDKKTKIIKFPDVNKVIQGDVKAIHISKGFGGIS